jgi:anti-anti-sigma regulatory factor
MEPTRGTREGETSGPVHLLGGADIESVAAMREQLLERLAGTEPVLVADCRRIGRAGVSLLQLLLVAESALALRGKTLRLTGLADEFRRDLHDAGMRGWFLELPTAGVD